MPYTTENPPERIKNLPEHAQEIFIGAFNSAWEQYEGDEEKCNAVAWAAVKTKYEKNEEGEWIMKSKEHSELISIFKTGIHTDSNGNTKTWTKEDLDQIVSKYNPSEHEAPIVIGHPKDSSPAWGWIESLQRQNEMLYAKPKDLVPEFVDMIKKGMFKKRSISLYPDGTLRHIGFLGATPPAVKGLPDVQFKEGQKAITIEFEDYKVISIGKIFQRLREWLIEKFGSEVADRIVSNYDIEDLMRPEAEFPKAIAYVEDSPERKAQEARSKKYGISIREGGNITKPSEWDNVPDDEWLDPVNYAYPCPDADQTRAAAVYWGRERNRNKYSKEDQDVINERLEKFRKKFKIGEAGKEETNMSFWEKLKVLFENEGIKVGSPEPKNFTEAEVAEKLAAKDKEHSEKIASLDEARKKKEEELKAKEDALKAKEAEAKKAAIKSFCDDLAKQGKITPAMMKLGMGLANFLEQIATIETVIEFGEGDNKKKQTPVEFMQSFLKGLPKAIEFKEVATDDKDAGSGSNAEKREKLISDYREKNKDVTYKQAVIAILKEHPELREEE